MATVMKIPTLIHEQNSYPGVTTRLLGNRVNNVCITFEQAKKYLKRLDNVSFTGNPTRSSLDNVNVHEASAYFGFDSTGKQRTVLVFGGSLGAATINQAMLQNVENILEQNVRVIWQTGNEDFERVSNSTKRFDRSMLWVNSFIERMDYAYAASDLVVCRAGATTIAELTRLGKPAILIPYPYAAADHQTENAKAMTLSGAALMLKDSEVQNGMSELIMKLISDTSKLDEMSRSSKHLGKPHAGRELAEMILALSQNKKAA